MMHASSILTESSKLKPEQIVKDALYALNSGWGYIRGKMGETWTLEEQEAVEADPEGREQTKLYGRKWIGKRVADSSGLIAWIFHNHGGYMPHGCNGIYERYCELKEELRDGSILRPGCLVFKISQKYENPVYHVGVYIGDGKVVEAHGTAKGVIQSTLFGWSHYGYPKGVDWQREGPAMKKYDTWLRVGEECYKCGCCSKMPTFVDIRDLTVCPHCGHQMKYFETIFGDIPMKNQEEEDQNDKEKVYEESVSN